jgi:hypothetical protein
LKDIAISEEGDAPGQKPGIIVEITDLNRDFRALHSEAGLQELAEIFALYLINYREVAVSVYGNAIDPSVAIANTQKLPLTSLQTADGKDTPVTSKSLNGAGRLSAPCIYATQKDSLSLR